MNVRGVSSLILYRAKVMCQFTEDSCLQHLLDNGHDHAVEILYYCEGIVDCSLQPVLRGIELWVEGFEIDFLPRIEQRDR